MSASAVPDLLPPAPASSLWKTRAGDRTRLAGEFDIVSTKLDGVTGMDAAKLDAPTGFEPA